MTSSPWWTWWLSGAGLSFVVGYGVAVNRWKDRRDARRGYSAGHVPRSEIPPPPPSPNTPGGDH